MWTAAPDSNWPRNHATSLATVLGNGLLLNAGGSTTENSTQLYNPTTNRWTDAAAMHDGRRGHRATRLADGRVLVTGGNTAGSLSATYEVFTP